jgi:hypothetical protein
MQIRIQTLLIRGHSFHSFYIYSGLCIMYAKE